MSRHDRSRWDQKWAVQGPGPEKPHELLLKHRHLLTGGSALDVACGRGQNALWLGEIGYKVHGVDISPVAVNIARERAVESGLENFLQFDEVDLNSWVMPPNAYELIIVFRFLDRQLFPYIIKGLRPGGLLLYATRHVGILNRDPAANPDFLLNAGELTSSFKDLDLLYEHEGPENAELVARKPVSG